MKTQFRKNTSTNFVLVDGSSKWMRFKKGGASDNNFPEVPITVYRNLTASEAIEQNIEMDNLISKFTYLLEKSRVIATQGIIMPYLHKREAGLLKIIVE